MGKFSVGEEAKILPASASVNVHFTDFNKKGIVTALAKVCGTSVAHVEISNGVKGTYIIPTRYLEKVTPDIELKMEYYNKLKEEHTK